MSYCGYITTLKNVRPHPNADRMKLADCFGNTVCVGLDAVEGEIIAYFPVDGQLSAEYCEQNNLVRKKDDAGNNIGGYLDPDKRNIKAIKLRGEKSDGIVMPLSSFLYTDVNLDDLNVGDTITVVNGHEICQKYIPRRNHSNSSTSGNKTCKKKVPIAPLFAEHADTEQLAYNLSAFKPGDEIEITLKMHGTSQRTGYLPVFKGYKRRSIWDWLKHKDGQPIYEYGYVSGTRRTVLENYDGGYYGSNEFREEHSKFFEGKLWKGETVYYEVVGYTHTGVPIMASGNTPKEYQKEYGKVMEFSYGCDPNGHFCKDNLWYNNSEEKPQSAIYVYRMTMTNEDGNIIEYSPYFMRYRCELMGVKTVPVLWKAEVPMYPATTDDDTVSPGEWVKSVAEQYYDGPDPIGKTHVREGVVIRIINRPKFTAYKHKNFLFKVVEGIVKDTAEAPDLEEAQEVENESSES